MNIFPGTSTSTSTGSSSASASGDLVRNVQGRAVRALAAAAEGSTVGEIASATVTLSGKALALAENVGGGVVDAVESVAEGIGSAAMWPVHLVEDAASGVASEVKEIAGDIVDGVEDVAKGAWNLAEGAVEGVASGVKTVAKAAVDGASGVIGGAATVAAMSGATGLKVIQAIL